MGFFRGASNFIIEGDQPPPNVPELMAQVAHIVQTTTNGLPSGYRFQGAVHRMDANTSRYLEEQLAQKDAALQAMKERKARKAEAVRMANMQHPSVGHDGSYSMGNGGAQTILPPQGPPGLLPGVGSQQAVNPMMLPGTLPADVSHQGTPFAPPQMNTPYQGSQPYHYTQRPDGNPMHGSYVYSAHSVQSVSRYYTPATYPPSHDQRHLNHQVVDTVEPDEGETGEQIPPPTNEWNDLYRPARRES